MANVVTKDLKTHMMSKIREKVRAVYFEREVGEELNEAEAALKAVVVAEIDALFPPADIEILEKHNCTDSMGVVRVYKRKDGVVGAEGSWSSRGGTQTEVCRGIKFPSPKSRDTLLREIAAKNQKVFLDFFNLSDRIECEIKTILEAYESRLKVGIGIKRLLAEYPGMKEFLPVEDDTPKAPVEPKKSELLIAEFEKSIAEEAVNAD